MINGFDSIVNKVKQALEDGVLPDEIAHQKLSPNRPSRLDALKANPSPRLSAVLVLLFPDDDGKANTVLMERNTYNGTHSGQVSFPGGKCEDYDDSFASTALREANEEVGTDTSAINVIGKLSDVYIPPSGFLVKPIVGVTTVRPSFVPDPREVQTIIETPLSLITDDNAIRYKKIKFSSSPVKVKAPYFDVHGHTVWGATAMMLSELRELILTEMKR
tara:strand:+ start:17427 stop:18080 length:654 start_codon:yes stop_codon:yes gene_type:complete